MKRKLLFLLAGFLVITFSSSAFAAVSLKRLGTSPFYNQALNSEADLRTMVERNRADLQTGFAKAGNEDLFSEFIAQFPTAAITSINVAPGEQIDWMLFRKKSPNQIVVLKDVTWDGGSGFEAFSFSITKDNQRYEFIVPAVCGNLSLKSTDRIAEPVAPAPTPAPVIKREPVQAVTETQERKSELGGPVVDVGLAQQFDPASYIFARGGYEFPLMEKLTIMGLVGGYARIADNDGDDVAFIADALLTYYFTEKMFVGGGAGIWIGDDVNLDLIVNLGYLIYERPEMKTSIFVEGRCEADELISSMHSRLGVGLRFQF